MENFSFMVSAVFSSDKSITFELCPEAVAFLRSKGCLAEGKTRGSWGMMADGKTMEIRPYAQADPVRKIVKDEEKIGVFSNIQRLKRSVALRLRYPQNSRTNRQSAFMKKMRCSWRKPLEEVH